MYTRGVAVVDMAITALMAVVVKLAYRKVNHLPFQVCQVAVHQFYPMHLEYLPKTIANKNDIHQHHHLKGLTPTHQHPRINLYYQLKAVLIHVHPNQHGKVQMIYFIIHML